MLRTWLYEPLSLLPRPLGEGWGEGGLQDASVFPHPNAFPAGEGAM